MELEQLKSTLEKLGQQLMQNRSENKEFILKITKEKSKGELNNIYTYEAISLITCLICLIFFFPFTIKQQHDTYLFWAGIITNLIVVVAGIYTIIKLNRVAAMNFHALSVIGLSKKLSLFKRDILREKKFNFILTPVIVVVVLPVVYKMVHHKDLFGNTHLYLTSVVAAIGLGIPIVLWVYKRIYENPIKLIEEALKEIEEIETEV